MFTYNAELNGYVSHDANVDFWGFPTKPIEINLERAAKLQEKRELKQKKLEQAVKALEMKHGWNNDRRAN